MRALITGAGGFAGQHLAELLVDSAATVFGVARGSITWRERDLCANDGFTLLRAELTAAGEARRVVGESAPDQIYLLAALSAPADSFGEPLATIFNNVACVLNVLEAAREIVPAARVLLVSSADVYGRSLAAGESIDETAPLAPDSPYAVSKAAQDLLGYQYHVAYGLDVVRVRPFNHLGPGQSERFVAASFAKQIAEAEARAREPVIEVGNLDTWRDFTDVRDMVRAYQLALRSGKAGAAYNLSTGNATAVRSVLEGLIALSPLPISIHFDPQRARPSDAPILVGNSERFRRETGWAPMIPLAQTLEDLLSYWRARVRLVGPRE